MSTIIGIDKDEAIAKLKEAFLGDPNVLFAFVFGSYAVGTQKKCSDLDVAAYFVHPPEGLVKLSLVNKLSDAAGIDVDVAVLNRASALLRHQVMKYGVEVIVKDSNILREFREKVIRDYDEYKYVSGMNKYDR